MDTECATGDNGKMLILPGGVEDGKITTREYDILKLKKDELKELCRAYGLNCSGNKASLQGHLRAFSANRDAWTRLNPEPRRMHRGPKAGKIAKAKSLKPSVRRANEIFNSEVNTHVPHLPYWLPDQELLALRTHGHKLYDWAVAVSTAYPSYVSKEDRIKVGQARLRKQALSQHFVLSYPTHPLSQDQATALPHQSFGNISLISNMSDPIQPVIEAVQHASLPFSASSNLATTPIMAPTPAPISLPASYPSATRTLKLRDGTHIEFTADEAGLPPAISFVDDLPHLNRMWDNKCRDWNHDSALIIKGVPIPIVYWRVVYGRSKSENSNSGRSWRMGDWKKLKRSWSEWKLIITQWRQSSEDNFWKVFSDSDGNRLNYKAIVTRLTEIWKAEDKRIADEARYRYGAEFGSIFWYKKSGVRHVKTKDRDIAKQYQQECAKLDSVYHSDDMDLESD